MLRQSLKLKVDPVLHRVFGRGEWRRLTGTEFRLLDALVSAKGAPVSSKELLQLMGAARKRSGPDYIKLYIWYLRRKIEDDPANPRIILTERGLGYRVGCRVVLTSAEAESGPRSARNLRLRSE